MLYYDDRDYLDYNNIDELYDDDYVFSDESDDDSDASVWEYDYHNLTDELIDD